MKTDVSRLCRASLKVWPVLSGGGVCRRIVVNDFDDVGERNFDEFAAAFDFDARFSKRLRCFHAADDAARARAVFGDDLDIIFAVERLECGESFGDFHEFFAFYASLRFAGIRLPCVFALGKPRNICRCTKLMYLISAPVACKTPARRLH